MKKVIVIFLILAISYVPAIPAVMEETLLAREFLFESGYTITEGAALPTGYLVVSGFREPKANERMVSFLAIFDEAGDQIGCFELAGGYYYLKGMMEKDAFWVKKAYENPRDVHSVVFDPANPSAERPYVQEAQNGVYSYCFENEIITLQYEEDEAWHIKLNGYDTQYTKLWSSALSFAENFRVMDITKTEDGYLVCGGKMGDISYSGFVWKLDYQGNLLWAFKDLGNAFPFNEVIMIENKSIVAKSRSTDRVVMIGTDGSLLHARNFYNMGLARIQNIASYENGFVLLGRESYPSQDYGMAKYTLLYMDEHMEATCFYTIYAMAGQQGNLGMGADANAAITIYGNTRLNAEMDATAFFLRLTLGDFCPMSDFVYPEYSKEVFFTF